MFRNQGTETTEISRFSDWPVTLQTLRTVALEASEHIQVSRHNKTADIRFKITNESVFSHYANYLTRENKHNSVSVASL